MFQKKLRISLKVRIFMMFLGILAATVFIFIVSFYRFISKSTFENLDRDYLSMANDLNDTSQNLLWKLTLTSQQLLENEEILNQIVSYQNAGNLYQNQTRYSELLDEISTLTMSETDIALLYLYDPIHGDMIYSSLPVDRQIISTNYLYKNDLFQYRGPASSQSTFIGNPVFILNRTAVLSNGNPVYFSAESGYYSLDKQFQALKQKSAYVAFTNHQEQILYSSIPQDEQNRLDMEKLLSGTDRNFHVFSQQASQGWSAYVIVPHSVYTS